MPVLNQKVYNITLPGLAGDHLQMNSIYEALLPNKGELTFNTIGERLQFYEYFRQLIIKVSDGENIGLDNKSVCQNNLLQYLKLVEINPNYYNPIYNNPYQGLPNNLLIYRSCFPIRINTISNSTTCSDNSIAINIRLYCLSIAEYFSFYFKQPIYRSYDVWRELLYYEYVREHIIKTRQCPNFVLLYAYFLAQSQLINYFQLKKNTFTQKQQLTLEFKNYVQYMKLCNQAHKEKKCESNERTLIPLLPDETDEGLQRYSGTNLLLLTESPDKNLYQFASKTYDVKGAIHKMITTGYHNDNVWLSIIFQIAAALATMQKHDIYLRKMSIKDNVFIKILSCNGSVIGYWKYIINGIPYYVPNNGFLVLIDTNFKDIEDNGLIEKRQFKIYVDKIFEQNYIDIDTIRAGIISNFKNLLSPNIFTREFTQSGVLRPSPIIMQLLNDISIDNGNSISEIISNNFMKLMNNRIGTYLKKDIEVPNIREINGNFKVGEMTIQVTGEDNYIWCLVKKINTNGTLTIITKDNPDNQNYITLDVLPGSLRQYNIAEKVQQNFKGDVNLLNEENLLEVYTLNA